MNQKRILLADDNDLDVFLVQEAMRTQGIDFVMQRCSDGRMALDQLMQADTIYLDLIILDLNIPQMSGIDVLTEVRAQPRFDQIPIIVLTSSLSREDREEALRCKADAFITKPSNLVDFLSEVGGTLQEWLCRMPNS